MTDTDVKPLTQEEIAKLHWLYADRLPASRIATIAHRDIYVDDLLATIRTQAEATAVLVEAAEKAIANNGALTPVPATSTDDRLVS